jgi:hypothetical protein
MFFKRPSFKYGGQAEGIKQTVRTNFSAGTNPNKTGSAFVKDIFESQAPTSFNVMNQGIAQGLQMKPNVAISGGSLDSSYLDSIFKKPLSTANTGDATIAETMAMESNIRQPKMTKMSEDLGEDPLGSDFDTTEKITLPSGETQFVTKPKGELSDLAKANLGIISQQEYQQILQKQKSERQKQEDKIKAERDFKQTVTQAEKDFKAPLKETNVADEFADITLGSAQDEKIANDLEANGLKALADDNPAKALDEEELKLANKEAESGLTGKFIPMFEKYLSPQAAEVKRDAFLAVAKLGFRLMNQSVGEAGLASVEDFEKIGKEKRQLRALAAMKGLDYEKDVVLADKKLREFKQGIISIYPELAANVGYLDILAADIRATEGTYNTSVGQAINRDAVTLFSRNTADYKTGQNPPQYINSIAKFAFADPIVDVTTNLVELPLNSKGKIDESFVIEPGKYYFSKGLKGGKEIYKYTGGVEKVYSDVKDDSKAFDLYQSPIGLKIR